MTIRDIFESIQDVAIWMEGREVSFRLECRNMRGSDIESLVERFVSDSGIGSTTVRGIHIGVFELAYTKWCDVAIPLPSGRFKIGSVPVLYGKEWDGFIEVILRKRVT